jgi:enoyl-CoA hydratase
MDTLVSYRSDDGIATLRMDDGKVNVMSAAMLGDINAALDRAEAEKAVVLLTGREGVFSAGFDLRVLKEGGSRAVSMVRSGFELAERVLTFPLPVVMACGGHAVAMGLFLLLSGDYRIGADGPYKLTANEVAIGLTMPYTAIEILRQRLAPAYFNRAVTLAEPFAPSDAVAGGLVDRVVPPEQLDKAALEAAAALRTLDLDAHAASKLRARAQAVAALRAAIEEDYAALRQAGRLA